jgi:hypothetical protein
MATGNSVPFEILAAPPAGKGWYLVNAQVQLIKGLVHFDTGMSGDVFYAGSEGGSLALLETQLALTDPDDLANFVLGSANATGIPRLTWQDKGLVMKTLADDSTPGADDTCRLWLTVQLRTLP